MELINAGKQPVTLLPGGSFFHHADSFAMIRGGHIDISILGAYEVAQNGDIANWMLPGPKPPAVGGAMDLVAGVKRVVVVMDHCDRSGASKVKKACSLPLTGKGVVDLLITDLGVFEIDKQAGRAALIELARGVTLDEITAKTEASFSVALR